MGVEIEVSNLGLVNVAIHEHPAAIAFRDQSDRNAVGSRRLGFQSYANLFPSLGDAEFSLPIEGHASIVGVGFPLTVPLPCDIGNLEEKAQWTPSKLVEAPMDDGVDHAGSDRNDNEVLAPFRQPVTSQSVRETNADSWKKGDNQGGEHA